MLGLGDVTAIDYIIQLRSQRMYGEEKEKGCCKILPYLYNVCMRLANIAFFSCRSDLLLSDSIHL
jgi:hypothetical protein